jgi:hypothetical protein
MCDSVHVQQNHRQKVKVCLCACLRLFEMMLWSMLEACLGEFWYILS